jgi:hypothetical protein
MYIKKFRMYKYSIQIPFQKNRKTKLKVKSAVTSVNISWHYVDMSGHLRISNILYLLRPNILDNGTMKKKNTAPARK